MRVTFLGNAEWSVPSLEALAESPHEIGLVVTREPKPAGRGARLTPSPVADAARALGLPLAEVSTVKRGPGLEALRSSRPDALVVVAYGEILPNEVLEIPAAMPVNAHFSLLPELRGAAPVQRALLEGLAATGVTTLRMDAGMDTGPVLLQQEESIDTIDDAGSLGSRLAAMGARLLVDTLDRLEAGVLEERPQDDALATFAPKLRPEDEVIDWSRPAELVVRQVRALAPKPGARSTLGGKTLKVFGAEARSRSGEGSGAQPGTLVPVRGPGRPTAFGVAAGDESVVFLDQVALEGRRRMSGEEFIRGYQPEPGEVLGR